MKTQKSKTQQDEHRRFPSAFPLYITHINSFNQSQVPIIQILGESSSYADINPRIYRVFGWRFYASFMKTYEHTLMEDIHIRQQHSCSFVR